MNLATTDRTARVGAGGATIDGDLAITTNSEATDTTSATAGIAGDGLGASIALAIINDTSTARVDDGADLGTTIDNLTITSDGTRTTSTAAETGADGGASVTAAPSIATTISNLNSQVSQGAGSNADISGNAIAGATRTGDTTTSASGDVDGGAGAAVSDRKSVV